MNKIERVGTFDIEGYEDYTGVEFRAVITFGKLQRQTPLVAIAR
jgi:hypothetical protein